MDLFDTKLLSADIDSENIIITLSGVTSSVHCNATIIAIDSTVYIGKLFDNLLNMLISNSGIYIPTSHPRFWYL